MTAEERYVDCVAREIDEAIDDMLAELRAIREDDYYASHSMDCELLEDDYRRELDADFECILQRAADRGCSDDSLRFIIGVYDSYNVDWWYNRIDR